MQVKPPKPPATAHSKKRLLTAEEKLAWKRHTQQDQKFSEVELDEDAPTPTPEVEIALRPPAARISQKQPRALEAPKKAPLRTLEKSKTPDIDRRTAQRFQKGKLSIDATLDLHGYGREAAYIHLLAFIHRGYQAGHRCVLVITGRGLFQKDKPVAERGVLRGALKGWLNDPAIRPFILAFEQAQIKDGGEGAFYILLKRRR